MNKRPGRRRNHLEGSQRQAAGGVEGPDGRLPLGAGAATVGSGEPSSRSETHTGAPAPRKHSSPALGDSGPWPERRPSLEAAGSVELLTVARLRGRSEKRTFQNAQAVRLSAAAGQSASRCPFLRLQRRTEAWPSLFRIGNGGRVVDPRGPTTGEPCETKRGTDQVSIGRHGLSTQDSKGLSRACPPPCKCRASFLARVLRGDELWSDDRL